MHENRPSLTAERVALRRAAHQLLDDPKVFDDPLALRIIGAENAALLRANPRHFEATPVAPFLRAFVAVRSRFAEDELAAAVERGVCQYVVLGAGLDTFALRNPYPQSTLRVFEVDYPATQAWKRARLEEIDEPLPENLTFAAVDFETQTLAEGLQRAGYDPGKGTFFSWLGVTEYLAPESVRATLRFLAAAPAGSGAVFDYLIPPALLGALQRSVFEGMARRVAAAGEPWRAFFDPAEFVAELRVMGFAHVDDNSSEALMARYAAVRQSGLRLGGGAHIMNVRV